MYAVIFSIPVLPLTYLPIRLVGNDRSVMGDHVNGRVANVFGIVYLGVIVLISVAALPVLVLSDMGQG